MCRTSVWAIRFVYYIQRVHVLKRDQFLVSFNYIFFQIIGLKVPSRNLCFLDSHSYLSMSLERARKSLGIESMVKGFFPHLLCNPSYWDLNLSSPPADMELYDLPPERKEEFDSWRNSFEGNYCFRDQLAHYNALDTLILHRVGLRFLKNSFQVCALVKLGPHGFILVSFFILYIDGGSNECRDES